MKTNLSVLGFTCCLMTGFFSYAQELDQPTTPVNPIKLHEATYEVPVKNADLLGSAVFPMMPATLSKSGNQIQVKFVIPTELTGVENTIALEGHLENGQAQLDYGNTKADCLADQEILMCKVAYQNLKIDQDQAVLLLNKRFQGDDLKNRLSIQKDFSTDPVGIIKIKLKSKSIYRK
jgi:hypothetical protein